MDTKEKFLETALDLFSKFGYSGVSVRDVAGVLGLRESAMYKHYKSKADILEKIVDRAKIKLQEFERSLPVSGGSLAAVVEEVFVRVYRFYTQDAYMSRFRRFMMISRYENEASNERFREMFIDKSLRYYESVFQSLAEQSGVSADARLMAIELYAPLFLAMNADDGQADAYEPALRGHVEKFFADYPFLEASHED